MKRKKVMRLLAPIAHKAMFEGFGPDGVADDWKVTLTVSVRDMRRIVDAYAKLWHKQGKREKRQKWMVKR